jgi:hypothetical protein
MFSFVMFIYLLLNIGIYYLIVDAYLLDFNLYLIDRFKVTKYSKGISQLYKLF